MRRPGPEEVPDVIHLTPMERGRKCLHVKLTGQHTGQPCGAADDRET